MRWRDLSLRNPTDRVIEVLTLAKQCDSPSELTSVVPEHVLLALAKGEGDAARAMLEELGVDLAKHANDIQIQQEQLRTGLSTLYSGVSELFARANEEAGTLGHNYLGTEHLLLGLLRLDGQYCQRFLNGLGVDIDVARSALAKLFGDA